MNSCELIEANTVRKIIINSISTVAFDKVTFTVYDCLVPMEEIAHRLGFILLTHSSLAVEKAAWCDIVNTTKENQVVRAADLTLDPSVKCCEPNQVIALLVPGDAIKFECSTARGTANQHAKFNPCEKIIVKRADDKFCVEPISTGVLTKEQIFVEAGKSLRTKIQQISIATAE